MNNPKPLSELIELAIGEIRQECRINDYDLILKEKACLIEDIFRVMRVSVPLDSNYVNLTGINAVKTFDELYDLTINDLELLLARMSAELRRYMKLKATTSLTRPFVPNWHYRTGRNPNKFRGDDGE